jgi:hypothetical protein
MRVAVAGAGLVGSRPRTSCSAPAPRSSCFGPRRRSSPRNLAGIARVDREPAPSIAGGTQWLALALARELGKVTETT